MPVSIIQSVLGRAISYTYLYQLYEHIYIRSWICYSHFMYMHVRTVLERRAIRNTLLYALGTYIVRYIRSYVSWLALYIRMQYNITNVDPLGNMYSRLELKLQRTSETIIIASYKMIRRKWSWPSWPSIVFCWSTLSLLWRGGIDDIKEKCAHEQSISARPSSQN